MADKLEKIILGPGVLVYPKVSRPDTYGEFADGKFKTKIAVSAEVAAPIQEKIKELAKKLIPGVKNPKFPWSEDDDGNVVFNAKSKDKPLIQDARNNKLPDGVLIGGGTKARIAVAVSSYTKKKPTGINLYLNAVRVLELVEYTSQGGNPFGDEEDGFEFEGAAEPTTGSDTQEDNENPADF